MEEKDRSKRVEWLEIIKQELFFYKKEWKAESHYHH